MKTFGGYKRGGSLSLDVLVCVFSLNLTYWFLLEKERSQLAITVRSLYKSRYFGRLNRCLFLVSNLVIKAFQRCLRSDERLKGATRCPYSRGILDAHILSNRNIAIYPLGCRRSYSAQEKYPMIKTLDRDIALA